MHENQQPQTEAFELSAAEREAIEHEMHHYEDPRAASIEALKIVQKQRGWVPDGAIHAIADVLGIPASDVEGVLLNTQISTRHISDISIKTTFRYHLFTLQSLCYIQQNVLSLNRSMDLSAPNKPCIGNPPFLPDIPHKNNEKRVLLQSQI